jgi:hypothetical protein
LIAVLVVDLFSKNGFAGVVVAIDNRLDGHKHCQNITFKIVYRKGSQHGKADALLQHPVFIDREGGTMSTDNTPLLGQQYWTNIASLSLENENDEVIVLTGF